MANYAQTSEQDSFDEHHEIIEIINTDGRADERLNVFLRRRCSQPGQFDYRRANITFVAGPIDSRLGGLDASALRRLAHAFNEYADQLEPDALKP